MKRVRTISAKDGGVSVKIVVTAESNGTLTREESERLADHLASKIMEAVASSPYLSTPLSKVRVR